MGGVDTMCRTRGDRQARRYRGRYLTEGTGVGREGWLDARDGNTIFRDLLGELTVARRATLRS